MFCRPNIAYLRPLPLTCPPRRPLAATEAALSLESGGRAKLAAPHPRAERWHWSVIRPLVDVHRALMAAVLAGREKSHGCRRTLPSVMGPIVRVCGDALSASSHQSGPREQEGRRRQSDLGRRDKLLAEPKPTPQAEITLAMQRPAIIHAILCMEIISKLANIYSRPETTAER
jgi:hypothetical protein